MFNVDYEVNGNLTFLARLLVSGAESPGDIYEAKVSDDGSPILQEDIFGLGYYGKDGIEERTPLIWAARSGYDKIISEILGKDESSPGWCSHLVFHTFESGRCIEKLHSSISCTSKIHADLQKQQSVTRQLGLLSLHILALK